MGAEQPAVVNFLRARNRVSRLRARWLEERRQAREMCDRVEDAPEGSLDALLNELPGSTGRFLVEELLRRSASTVDQAPKGALHRVDLAQRALTCIGWSSGGVGGGRVGLVDLSAGILAHRADALRALGDRESAQEAFEEAYRLLGSGSGDLALLARVLRLQANLLRASRRYDDALALLAEAEALLRSIAANRELRRVLELRARLFRLLGELPRAKETEAEARVLAAADPQEEAPSFSPERRSEPLPARA